MKYRQVKSVTLTGEQVAAPIADIAVLDVPEQCNPVSTLAVTFLDGSCERFRIDMRPRDEQQKAFDAQPRWRRMLQRFLNGH